MMPESEYKTNFMFDNGPTQCHIKVELDGKRGPRNDQFKLELKSVTEIAGSKEMVMCYYVSIGCCNANMLYSTGQQHGLSE